MKSYTIFNTLCATLLLTCVSSSYAGSFANTGDNGLTVPIDYKIPDPLGGYTIPDALSHIPLRIEGFQSCILKSSPPIPQGYECKFDPITTRFIITKVQTEESSSKAPFNGCFIVLIKNGYKCRPHPITGQPIITPDYLLDTSVLDKPAEKHIDQLLKEYDWNCGLIKKCKEANIWFPQVSDIKNGTLGSGLLGIQDMSSMLKGVVSSGG